MFTGIVMMLIALYVMAATSACEQLKFAVLSPYYNALYAGAGLVLPLGLVVFFALLAASLLIPQAMPRPIRPKTKLEVGPPAKAVTASRLEEATTV